MDPRQVPDKSGQAGARSNKFHPPADPDDISKGIIADANWIFTTF